MQIKMEIQIKFNRNVDKKKDYISAGGFEMIMNGKPIQFDFMTSYGKVSKTEADVCVFELEEPDNKSFPDFALITPDDIRKVSDIIECFVYTGEDEEHDVFVLPSLVGTPGSGCAVERCLTYIEMQLYRVLTVLVYLRFAVHRILFIQLRRTGTGKWSQRQHAAGQCCQNIAFRFHNAVFFCLFVTY